MPEAVHQVASADFPAKWGDFRVLGFERTISEGSRVRCETAMVLIMGDLHGDQPLVRIHSQCLTGDVFGSLRCDCGLQLILALSMIREERAGVLIYEQQEGRGIGLIPKLQAYELQDQGYDTIEANEKLGMRSDYRDFVLPAAIVRQLGLSAVRLLTNNPDKINALQRVGIAVTRIACEPSPPRQAARYLMVKKNKMGQLLTSV